MSSSLLGYVLEEAPAILANFEKLARPSRGDCLKWIGKYSGKHPRRTPIIYFSPFGKYGKSLYKVLWTLHHKEEVNDGDFVMRFCGTSECCNPYHLILVPGEDQRAFIRLRSAGLITKHVAVWEYKRTSRKISLWYAVFKSNNVLPVEGEKVEDPESYYLAYKRKEGKTDMARPKKTQDVKPQIVDEESISLVLAEDDEVPNFEEEEENFNERDLDEITEIAAKIVTDTRESVPKSTSETSRLESSVESFREEVTRTVGVIISALTSISNKVDSLILRDDPSKILYTMDASIEEKLSIISCRLDALEKSTAPIIPLTPPPTASPALDAMLAKLPPKEVVDKIRKWLGAIPKGKSAALDTVTKEIGKRLDMDPREVHGIIQVQEDIVKVTNGKIYSI